MTDLPPISVVLVDDNLTFLRIVMRFLHERGQGEVCVLGATSSGAAGLVLAEVLRPQVVLIDLALPDIHGLEVIPRLRASLPEASLIVVTMLDADVYRPPVLAAGADALVSKDAVGAELLPAIQCVARRRAARDEMRTQEVVYERLPS